MDLRYGRLVNYSTPIKKARPKPGLSRLLLPLPPRLEFIGLAHLAGSGVDCSITFLATVHVHPIAPVTHRIREPNQSRRLFPLFLSRRLVASQLVTIPRFL